MVLSLFNFEGTIQLSEKITVQELSENNPKIWDDLVQNSDQGTVFHQFEWLKIMEKYTNTKLILLTATHTDEIFAGIPLFLQKGFAGLVDRILSPPYPTMVQYLGPVFIGYDCWKESKREFRLRRFQEKLDEYLSLTINPHSISIITPPNMLDIRSFMHAGYYAMPRFTYVADVSNLENVWKGFEKDLRQDIARAEKRGLKVEEANLSGFNLVTNLLSNRLREKGEKLDVSSEYLLNVYNKFYPQNLRALVCKHEQEEVGGIVFVLYKNKVSMWLAAATKSLKGVSPSDLLYWETIKWANKNGFRYCEIISAESQNEYKSKYNFDLIPYYFVKKMRGVYGLLANTYNIIRKR